MKSKYFIFSLLLFPLLISAGFSGEPQKQEWKGKVTEEDGVVIVKNPKEPLYKNAAVTIIQRFKDRPAGGRAGVYVFQCQKYRGRFEWQHIRRRV